MPEGHGLGLRQHDAPRPRLNLRLPLLTMNVEVKLDLPTQYRTHYDQGAEGACVGYGYSWMMSILNRRKYDAEWLYRQAQLIDPWPDTPPGEGTSEASAADILMQKGHSRIWGGKTWLPRLQDGIGAVEWADSVDTLRACILSKRPFGMAIPWYTNFDKPQWDQKRGWIIGEGDLGSVRGWHFICSWGATDLLAMFRLVNSWGNDYPLVKIPYKTVERLMGEGATFAVITDRV